MNDILPKPMNMDTLQKLVDKNKKETNVIKRQGILPGVSGIYSG